MINSIIPRAKLNYLFDGNFEMLQYSHRDVIKAGKLKISLNGDLKDEYNIKMLAMRSQLMKYLKTYRDNDKYKKFNRIPEGLWIINKQKLLESNKNLLSVLNKEIYVYDVKSCYTNLFYQLFEIPKNLREKFDKFDKIQRNKIIGSFAANPLIKVYKDGKLVRMGKRYNTDEGVFPPFGFVYFNCVRALAEANEAIIRYFKPSNILMIYQDAIFIDNSNFVKTLKNEFTLEFKSNSFNKKLKLTYALKDKTKLTNFEVSQSQITGQNTIKLMFSNNKLYNLNTIQLTYI